MLESIITSKTRIKIILKFFLNPASRAYLRGLAEEFGESTNAVRVELNRLTNAGLLETEKNGRTIVYKANTSHSLFPDLHSLVKKYTGIDKLINTIINHLGDVEYAFITGDYAKGIDSGLIDLVVVGKIDKNYLELLVNKTENMINRKIRVLVLNKDEFKKIYNRIAIESVFPVWEKAMEERVRS